MIKLYGSPVSGNSHRVYNFLHILELPFDNKIVDFKVSEQKSDYFLAMNPLGQVPVLTDNDVVLRDSTAILTYLARQYDKSNQWLPTEPDKQAYVQQWLSVAVHEVMNGPFVIRGITLFGMSDDFATVKDKTDKLFNDLFEPHLKNNQWLVGDNPTIADIACYSYIARVTDGDYSLAPYPELSNWLSRIEAIKGFAPMLTGKELGFS